MQQEPSAGVQQPLDKHVHLISSHQFPLVAHLNLEQAFRYLFDAPPIVKRVAPMSWTYVNAPQDGTIWLEWLSPRQNGGRFPTDGYVWGDPEQTYRQDYNGYTVELLVHQLGFRPGVDHMTSHARTRYHFIAKAPNVNAAAPDPALWIVHYHEAQQQRILPANQVQIDQYTRQLIGERRWLETQGRIERREFMLHDRDHWPSVTIPSAHNQQVHNPDFYGGNTIQNQGMMMAQNRYGQPPFPQPAGPPSAKRQRSQGPVAAVPVAGEENGVVNGNSGTSIEDEEYTALGDYFDHLTPREISLTRYQQHHQWMEEVFSSPYASANIVPADLGLGLMGELKGLTEGIVQAPSLDTMVDRIEGRPAQPRQAPPFTNLKKQQVEEFNKRVQTHLEEGQADIERMKAEHAAKMQEWKKTKLLTQAERQLRRAQWDGHGPTVFRVGMEVGNGKKEADKVKVRGVEDVISSVEEGFGLKIKAHHDATLVEKGGLEKNERAASREGGAADATSQQASRVPSSTGMEAVSFQQDPSTSLSDATEQKQEAPPHQVQAVDGHMEGLGQAGAAPVIGQQPAISDVPTGTSGGQDDLLGDGMDLDATDLNFDLGETPAQMTPTEAEGLDGTASLSAGQQEVASAGQVSSGLSAEQTVGSGGVNNEAAANANAAETAGTANDTQVESTDAVETSMFNDATFDFADELGATGDEVGDGLIDFGAGDDLAMDESAFGDALHGMDESGNSGDIAGEGQESGAGGRS